MIPIEGARLVALPAAPAPLPLDSWWGGAGLAQWNFSTSAAGVLRGMHLHGGCDEVYLLLEGSVEVGLFDLRPGSPTEGRSAAFRVSAPGPAVEVPAGVVHGLLFTSPGLLLTGRSSEHHGHEEWRCRWDDPALGLTWSARWPLLSPADAEAPSLAALAASYRQWCALERVE